jgi:Family of unknown function (DUF5996)
MTLPELHLADWRPTKDTLHLYCQILGKVRLATTTPRNHWWNVPLYVDVRGLTTRRLHHGETEFEIALDFIDDALVVQTGDGRIESISLAGGLPVAGFDACLHDTLRNLGVDVAIQEKPFGVPMTTPFREDTEQGSWDHEAVARFAGILDWSDSVLEEFSGWFNGKTSPVHFFWHGFDLAVTRFSGRPSKKIERRPRHPGGVLARGHFLRLLARGRQRPGRLLLLHRAGARGFARATACRRLMDAYGHCVITRNPPLRRGADF